jgi:hypothetical protein
MKVQLFVMPAWIAGIQARKDASGDITCLSGFQRAMLE